MIDQHGAVRAAASAIAALVSGWVAMLRGHLDRRDR